MSRNNTNPTKEVVMSKSFTPGTARWLSANGHPNYGSEFAARVYDWMSSHFDADDIAHATVPQYSAMVWAGVRQVRAAW